MSSSKKHSTKVERTLSTEAAAAMLEDLARGLGSSEMLVVGETPVILHPAREAVLKLEAKSSPKKASISIKLSWQPPAVASAGFARPLGPRPPQEMPTASITQPSGAAPSVAEPEGGELNVRPGASEAGAGPSVEATETPEAAPQARPTNSAKEAGQTTRAARPGKPAPKKASKKRATKKRPGRASTKRKASGAR